MFSPSQKTKPSRTLRRLGLGILMGTVLVGLIPGPKSHADTDSVRRAKEMGTAFAEVARLVSPAVVSIRVDKKVTINPADQTEPPGFFGGDMLRRFFGRDFGWPSQPEQHLWGQGSGFIISRDGYILTNNHVIADADQVKVKTLDDREFDAKIVGTDAQTDVAVIKIDAKNLPSAPLGDSDRLEVGEWVLALGNPFGLDNTLTAGIVSAKSRSRIGLADYEEFIQTDAAINPGNSGGPLVDLDGRVVGINTAIATRTGGYMGVGFAIPINLADEIRRQLVEHGSVDRGYLGVVIQDLSPDLAASLGIENVKGIAVSEVENDSPAAKSGLERGDVIIALDGRPVEKIDGFRNQIALTAPGTKVGLTVLRDGRQKQIEATLGRKPGDQLASSGPSESHELGLAVEDLTADLATQLGYVGRHGVLVTKVASGSAAAEAGMKAGMLIEEVNRKPVRSVADFRSALKSSSDDRVLLVVRDDHASRFVVLKR